MNVLVTGATGYIGSCLVGRLIKLGHSVTAIVLQGTGVEALEPCRDDVHICIYDGSMASLHEAVTVGRPDVTIHVASLFLVSHKPVDVDRLIASNVLFPTQLLECLDQAGYRKLLNVGTSWQNYLDASYNPVNLYAATKQAFYDLLSYYVEGRGWQAVTLKLFDTYGIGDQRPKLMTLLRQTAREGNVLKMSPGEQKIDPVYIDDIMDAFVLALDHIGKVSASETYGVCTEHPVSLRELVEIYSAVVRKPLRIEWGGLPYRPREVMMTWKNYSLLPGWKAKVSLREGIALMEKDASIGGLLA
jgi:nucleoside-diphosphate-sugar epimerase